MTLEEKLHEQLDWLMVKHIDANKIISDIMIICQQEMDDERNIGAKLMAERILNELKNPSGGKFGCDAANAIIDYHPTRDR